MMKTMTMKDDDVSHVRNRHWDEANLDDHHRPAAVETTFAFDELGVEAGFWMPEGAGDLRKKTNENVYTDHAETHPWHHRCRFLGHHHCHRQTTVRPQRHDPHHHRHHQQQQSQMMASLVLDVGLSLMKAMTMLKAGGNRVQRWDEKMMIYMDAVEVEEAAWKPHVSLEADAAQILDDA
jgi:hypothetical protein